MSFFREFFNTQSDQNIHQNALNCTKFKKFLGELAPPSIIRATIINMHFYMKIAIFYSKLFQNTHQRASIVKRFQQFLHEKFENCPIASVYLYKKLHFLKKLYKKIKILKILL